MFNGFRGNVGGSVQGTYTDQPGVAVAGMIAFASDISLIDAIFVGETEGLAAGTGVKLVVSAEGVADLQRPHQEAFLPTGAEAAADLDGIVVFDETMQSDANGVPGYNKGRVARILRTKRAGGRIYVKVRDAIVPGVSTVNWVIGASGNYLLGDFAPADLGAGDTVAIATAKWVTAAAAGGIAMIEFGL